MSNEYNGHPSWEHRNVTLWVCNDPGLYGLVIDHDRETFIYLLTDAMPTTPDGAEVTPELTGYAYDTATEE